MVAFPSVVFGAETSQSVKAAAEEVAAPVEVNEGKMLYSANGSRIANVYRVSAEGNPQIIMDGRLITVPHRNAERCRRQADHVAYEARSKPHPLNSERLELLIGKGRRKGVAFFRSTIATTAIPRAAVFANGA